MKKEVKANGNKKNKLPFAIFVCPKTYTEKNIDYRQTLTDIISDRIQEKRGNL